MTFPIELQEHTRAHRKEVAISIVAFNYNAKGGTTANCLSKFVRDVSAKLDNDERLRQKAEENIGS